MEGEERRYSKAVTVSEIVKMKKDGLIIIPEFQRHEVWGAEAKIMLIDSILNNFPIPKIFVGKKEGEKEWTVIDGQQRLAAIWDFVNNKFSLDKKFLHKKEVISSRKETFKKLTDRYQNEIKNYNIHVDILTGYNDSELKIIYVRFNKYTEGLKNQEIRRVNYPGDFLELSERMAIKLDEALAIFSDKDKKRFSDVEFTSELLILIMSETQSGDKKMLDDFYERNMFWEDRNEKSILQCEEAFEKILNDIKKIFPDALSNKTEFKKKSHFYSLFDAIKTLHEKGHQIGDDASIRDLGKNFKKMDVKIARGSDGDEDTGKYTIASKVSPNLLANRIIRRNTLIEHLKKGYTHPTLYNS